LIRLECEQILLLVENRRSTLLFKRSRRRFVIIPPRLRQQLTGGKTRALPLIPIRIDQRRVGPLPNGRRAARKNRPDRVKTRFVMTLAAAEGSETR
jgi:hypothetical protein